jgi:restriction endonuclease Mrr
VEAIPYPVFEAAVRVAGEALHWKASLKQIMRNCGVSENGYVRYADLNKYRIFRSIWDDLDRAGPRGRQVQHKLIAALANLEAVDPKAPDPAAGREALADLRRLAQQADLLVSPEDFARQERRRAAASNAQEVSAKREQLATLLETFRALHSEGDKQRRGYALEKLLTALFRLAELDYHGSYKTDTDQIDGAVTLDSFTYLIEARWRKNPAADTDLGAFAHKVERRIDATRGMFISMAGFRPEVVGLFRRSKDNRLVLVDGSDLAWILEGRIDFAEALREKVKAASVEGEPLLRLMTL